MPIHTPSKFEEFLSPSIARRYMNELSSFKRLYAEVRPDAKDITILFGQDMHQFYAFRKSIGDCMLGSPAEKAKEATKWISFLKARIELLDFNTSFYGNFAAYLGGAAAVFIALREFTIFSNNNTIAFLAAVTAMGFAALRSIIDRRRAWYKFLVAHLEPIRDDFKSAVALPSTQG